MVKVKPVKQTKINGLLREDLGLTGTKDGCNKALRCMYGVSKWKGFQSMFVYSRKISWQRSHDNRRFKPTAKDVYAYAFAKTGAVQCGYCIPGMVISAQGLLNKKPEPKRRHSESYTRKHLSLYRICENNRSHSVSC